MKSPKTQILAVVVTLLLVVLACGGSVTTASIASAKMAADSNGTQETTVFSQDQTFYCIVELANAPDDTKVKAVWTAVNAEGQEPNLLIDQAEATGSGTLTFNLTNDQLWPVGTYKVDLYLNDTLDRTIQFEVQ